MPPIGVGKDNGGAEEEEVDHFIASQMMCKFSLFAQNAELVKETGPFLSLRAPDRFSLTFSFGCGLLWVLAVTARD